jgi:AcrR family transcriptional regulator
VADRTACGDAGLRGQGIRPGGHPDGADTRTAILAAARRAFAEKGFDNATIRGIAREAGVDPALVHHYFGTKAELFATAMRLPVDPREVAATVLAGPREEVGERLVRCVLGLIAEPETEERIVGLLRSAMSNDQVLAAIHEFFSEVVAGEVASALGIPPLRLEAAISQIVGIVLIRHILRVEPMASAQVDELVDLLAPTIQRYLGGLAVGGIRLVLASSNPGI